MKKSPPPKGHRINLRLDADEWVRLERIFEIGRSRSRGFASQTAMLKELMGLLPPNLFTEEDRRMLLPEPQLKLVASRRRSPSQPVDSL